MVSFYLFKQAAMKATIDQPIATVPSAERLALVAELTDNAVIITDAQGYIEWVNRGFERVTGYRSEEVIGKKPGHLLQGPNSDPETIAYMREQIRRGEGFECDLLNYRKEGTEYWLHVDARPLHDEQGNLNGFFAIERDLTEEKEAKAKIAQAGRHAAELVEAIDRVQGRVEFTPNGTILEANENFAHLLGYEPQELVGLEHREVVPQAMIDSGEYDRFWQELAAGRSHLGDFERVARDGTTRWILGTYFPIRAADGSVAKVIKYAIDQTARRESEQQSREAHARLAELARVIRDSPNELYMFEPEGLKFVEVNEGATKSSGYLREELLQMTPLELLAGHNEASFRKLIEPLTSGEKSLLEFQADQCRKEGDTYPVQITLHKATYGEIAVFVAFVTDLTNVRRLEQQLSRAQKLESIGQMAAGIAHEINTPMQYVGGNIGFLADCSERLFRVVDRCRELLFDEENPLSWTERRDQMQRLMKENHFDRIREQLPAAINDSREGVKRTVSIVRAMRDFSHPGKAEKGSVVINDLIQSTIEISRNRWKQVAQVELDLDPELPAAPMFASEINQVLLNLIVNAGDAVADKYAGERLGTIEVRTHATDEWIVLQVTDDGCGMPEEVQKKAFDPFYTTKEVGKGTGQGLAITHGVVVEQHRGEISIDSVPGEGTIFTVKIPRQADPLPATSTDSATMAASI